MWSYFTIHSLDFLGSVDPSLFLKLLFLLHQPHFECQLVLLPLQHLFLMSPLLCLKGKQEQRSQNLNRSKYSHHKFTFFFQLTVTSLTTFIPYLSGQPLLPFLDLLQLLFLLGGQGVSAMIGCFRGRLHPPLAAFHLAAALILAG